ncbi:YncE family protein [Granulicella arctica]|uniref:DNA-binding beta-propeller fold protein YncE n=1 Tax=Granulicella arctica TaxID=940613 RepID=A0A7Y9TU09_9BACT|nr:YncE family protein [Granulicella arctica]NYF80473.1 DNA-binding beta-propeller fold protein YncE [Granulicella arctica]
MRLKNLVYCLPLAVCTILPFAHAQPGPYAVIDRWTIGGEGGWDYLTMDSVAHLLYVTHGTRVEVIDTKTGKSVGAITGLKGTHGVALDSDGKYGYISEGAGNNVVVFDRKSFAKVESIPAGTNPDGIIFEPVTKTVWAFNGKSSDATVIDTAAMKVIGTVKLSGKPEFPQVDGKGTVFVNIESKNSIVRLDAKSLKVAAEWPLTGCESPSGLTMDTVGRRLFSVCDEKVMSVTDADSGKILKLVPVGDGPDAARYDAVNHLAFSSNGEGTLTVVDTSTSDYKVIQTLPTQKSARTMAMDTSTDTIYLAAAVMGPKPAATAENPRPRATVTPGSFTILVVGRK